MDRYYFAVNGYRNSTSSGFDNTWSLYWVASRAARNQIVKQGLPVSDEWFVGDDGRREAVVSTNGVRMLTAAERSRVKRDSDAATRWVTD